MRVYRDTTYLPHYYLEVYGGGVAVEIVRPMVPASESVAFLQGDDATALLEELDTLDLYSAINRLAEYDV